jgi:murein endopeptidase
MRRALLLLATTLLTAGCAAPTAEVRVEELARPEEPPSLPVKVEPIAPTDMPEAVDKSDRILSFLTPRGITAAVRFRQTARSIGAPNRGALEGGACLSPKGPGYVHVSKSSCGTDEMVAVVQWALREMQREYPKTAPVVVGALSKPGGGRLKPHKSHRSGRDIDFGLYATGNQHLPHFQPLPLERIDFKKTFLLMAYLISSGRVTNIFVNHRLQPYLYEAARSMGYDRAQLDYLFEWPRGAKSRQGLIRHERGHMKHFHVRFACPEGDPGCVE